MATGATFYWNMLRKQWITAAANTSVMPELECNSTYCFWQWPTAEDVHPPAHSEPAASMTQAAAAHAGGVPAVQRATAGPQTMTTTTMTLAEMCADGQCWRPAPIMTARNPASTQCRCAAAVNVDKRNMLLPSTSQLVMLSFINSRVSNCRPVVSKTNEITIVESSTNTKEA